MNPAPDREVALFAEAVRLPPGERIAFLERACGGDAGLRQRVEALLQVHEEVGDFMEDSSVNAAAAAQAAVSEKPGDRIGRYKLLERIGEGGCGLVYMAEQEEPVRRRVAIKIIKPGMDTKSVIARFEAERQALALMDHPGIAKVLDAGATDSGLPYFVMELVRGTKITDYCDEHSLCTKSRLQLFVQVCHAVQHAHQKGIIHRDIKPSNILVTTNLQGLPVPVVIDFGIAKATTDQQLTDKTLFTAFGMLIGTPAYMSPEQTALTSVDVDTRSDIYSLGVLLYELVTGAPPFDTRELLKAGLDEVRRVIREEEPLRPSTRLSKMTNEALTSVAQQRRTEAPGLVRAVRGDLDWIAMRALEKDRTRRYETANGLALDVQRYLANEAILARPPSNLYRLQKTIARNKGLFAGVVIVLLVLIISLIIVAAALRHEQQARQQAESAQRETEKARRRTATEAEKSDQVTKFLEEMLRGAGPFVAQGRDTTMLREIVDRAAKRVQTDLGSQPATRAHLQIVVGEIYHQLGLLSQAERYFREAIAVCRDPKVDDGRLLATALADISWTVNNSEATRAASESLALRRRLFGNDSAEVATSLRRLHRALSSFEGKYPEAEAAARECLAIRVRLFGDERLEGADALVAVAFSVNQRGDYPESISLYRKIVAIRTARLGPEDPALASPLQVLAFALGKDHRWSEAESAFQAALQLRRKYFGDKHPEVARTQLARGFVLKNAGKFPEAEAAFREVIEIDRTATPPNRFAVDSHHGLGVVLFLQGRLPEAESALRESFRVAQETTKPGHVDVSNSVDMLATVLIEEGKSSEAEAILNSLLPPELVSQPVSINLLMARADFFARQHRWREGAADAAKALTYRPTDGWIFEASALLLLSAGERDAHRELCAQATRFRGTTDVIFAQRVARACLLAPAASADLSLPMQLADFAANSPARASTPGIQCGKALAEYRRGNYSVAIEWAERALGGESWDLEKCQGYAILAMAHLRLGRRDAADTAMNQYARLRESKLPAETSEDWVSVWREWVVADTLMREATELARTIGETAKNRGHHE